MNNASDPRADLENRLGGLYNLLERFDGLQQQVDAAYQRHAHLYVSYKKKWSAGMYWLWVLISTMVLSVVVFMIFVGVVTASTGSFQSGSSVGPQLGILILFLFPLPVALIASGILVGVRNARVPAANAQRQHHNQETAKKIGELAALELAPVEAQFEQTRQEFQANYRGWFPEKYLSTVDVGACWQIVHDHRAGTVQEAVNRYLTDQHEQYLRNAASTQLAEQQRATRVARMNGIINAGLLGANLGATMQGNKDAQTRWNYDHGRRSL